MCLCCRRSSTWKLLTGWLDRPVLYCRIVPDFDKGVCCICDPDGSYMGWVAAVGPAAAVMEEGMMMINIVKLLNTCSSTVDKNKPTASSRQQHSQQQPSQPNQSHGPPDVVPASVAKGERKDQSTKQLRELLAASNRRFQAVTIVLQQTLTEVRKFYL